MNELIGKSLFFRVGARVYVKGGGVGSNRYWDHLPNGVSDTVYVSKILENGLVEVRHHASLVTWLVFPHQLTDLNLHLGYPDVEIITL